MARIDPGVLDDAVQAAQARLAAAREDLAKQQAIFDRDQVLFDNQAIARQAFEVSKAQLEAVRAAEVTAARALASAQTLLLVRRRAGALRGRGDRTPGGARRPGRARQAALSACRCPVPCGSSRSCPRRCSGP